MLVSEDSRYQSASSSPRVHTSDNLICSFIMNPTVLLTLIFVIVCLLQLATLLEARRGGDVIILGGFGDYHGTFGHLGGALTLGSLFGLFGDGDVILGRRR